MQPRHIVAAPLRIRLSTSVYSTSELATEGGDLAHAFRLADGTLCIGVWDAAGHGEAAYCDAAVVDVVLRAELHGAADLIAALKRVNRLLNRTAAMRVAWPFVAGFFGIIDVDAHVLRFVSCGHETALIAHASGEITHLTANSPLLGIDDDATFGESLVRLESGDAIVIASDGISEARPIEPPRTFFGAARVGELFAARRNDPEADAAWIVSAATAYAGGKLSDDAAALVLRFT
jgi:sigma-B regulation protein RsbU (phosphoserine phosphatase)